MQIYPAPAVSGTTSALLDELVSAADKVPYFTGAGSASTADFTAAGRALVDDATVAAQCTTLGLGTGNSPVFAGTVIEAASPTLTFKDSDCTDTDANATIIVVATDTGSGTEDADVSFAQQVAGTPVNFLVSDADGALTLGYNGQSVYAAKLVHVVPVVQVTATATPAATDSSTVYTNEGDTNGATINLPPCAAGLRITGVVQAGQTLTITAAAGDTIRVAGLVTEAAGSITSAIVGSVITLLGINDTEWVDEASAGTWTVRSVQINFGRRLIWGEMHQYNQTFTLAIDIVNVYHPIRNCLTGAVKNITFDAGSTGAVASIANGPTGYITCTSTAHGLLNGEIVYLTNSTDYDGQFVVANRTDNTFDVLETWTQNRPCNWYQPSTLKVPADGAGTYRVTYSLTADAASNGKNFKFELVYGGMTAITHADYSASERLFGTSSDYSVLSSSALLELAAEDYVWLQTKNTTDATDLQLRHCNINLTRLG